MTIRAGNPIRMQVTLQSDAADRENSYTESFVPHSAREDALSAARGSILYLSIFLILSKKLLLPPQIV
jgi:hypothetical protein